MIDEQITVPLPVPWPQGKFETEVVGPINYLVGPNGSGKSRFAAELLSQLRSRDVPPGTVPLPMLDLGPSAVVEVGAL